MKHLRWWLIDILVAMPFLLCVASLVRPAAFGIAYASAPQGNTQEWRELTVRLNGWACYDGTWSSQSPAMGFPAPPGIHSDQAAMGYYMSLVVTNPPGTEIFPLNRVVCVVPAGDLFLIALVVRGFTSFDGAETAAPNRDTAANAGMTSAPRRTDARNAGRRRGRILSRRAPRARRGRNVIGTACRERKQRVEPPRNAKDAKDAKEKTTESHTWSHVLPWRPWRFLAVQIPTSR
jgi:hypothetical protein